jgi:hypothetical protein
MEASVAGQGVIGGSAVAVTDAPAAHEKPVCLALTNRCELQSLSASQIGAVVAALLSFVVLLWQWHSRHHGDMAMEYWFLFSVTAVYYIINELAFEEKNVADLRKLRFFLNYLEFGIRVLIVVGLALAAEPLIDSHDASSDIVTSLKILILIYGAFLLWDVIVFLGGQRQILKYLWIADALGFVATLASLKYFRETDMERLIVILMAFALGGFSVSNFKTAGRRLSALFDRSRLR